MNMFKVERNLLLAFVVVLLFAMLFFVFHMNFFSSLVMLIILLMFYMFLIIINKLRKNEQVFNKKLEEMDDLTTLVIFLFLGGIIGLTVWTWANINQKKLNERMLFITLILTLLSGAILLLVFMFIMFYPIIMRAAYKS